jgi:hypothetical protein
MPALVSWAGVRGNQLLVVAATRLAQHTPRIVALSLVDGAEVENNRPMAISVPTARPAAPKHPSARAMW